jgi:hypothetical protein
MEKTIIVKQKTNKKINIDKVIKTIEALDQNEEWSLYIESVAEELDIFIEETKRELLREKGKVTNTASLKYTGLIKQIKEKIQEFVGVVFNEDELVELLKVVNTFLKRYGMHIHPLPGKGLFITRINGNENKSELVDRIEMRFKEKLMQRE